MPSTQILFLMITLGGSPSIAVQAPPCPISWDKDSFVGKVVANRSEACAEVEQAIRSEYRADTAERLRLLQELMRESFVALPKTKLGGIDTATTRYLLHRHFLRSRAWRVNGLAPSGRSDISSPTEFLQGVGIVKQLFEERLAGRGLDLKEVASLAAMVENRMHKDTVEKFRKHAQALQTQGVESMEDLELVLFHYLMSFNFPNAAPINQEQLAKSLVMLSKISPRWKATQTFVEETLRSVLTENGHQRELSFVDAERVVVAISEALGRFENADCHDLKSDLIALERDRPGLVSLRDFDYAAMYNGKRQFVESLAYLRKVGITDESSEIPSIIIPNYIDSPSQSITLSDSYSITCVDECEPILLKIEEEVAAPFVTADRLYPILARLSSETQPARSDGLPEDLWRKLQEIAVHSPNKELIAVHGRLFAQWLHHAFPRECPYPHPTSKGSEFLTPEEFEAKMGEGTAYADSTEQEHYAALNAPAVESQELPWDVTEEVVAPYPDRVFRQRISKAKVVEQIV